MNKENVDKGKVTTGKSLVLKSCSILEFHSEYYIQTIEKLAFSFTTTLHPQEKNSAGKWHDMFVSWHNNFDCKCTRDYTERCKLLSEQFQ